MIPINSQLLELIEREIVQNTDPTFQKVLPISDYTYETKKTLDILVEKYGGFVSRYDDKIVILINYSTSNVYKNKIKEVESKSESFEKINSIFNRLEVLEEKIDKIIEEQTRITKDANKSVYSYLDYFKPKENKKEIGNLVNEIINHH